MSESTSIATEILEPGAVVGDRYEVKRIIGAGGMAAVYLARDKEKAEKSLAVKVLHKEFASDKIYLKRFIREVQLMSKVSHPNVVETYDISTDGDFVYFTMEYVPGESLERLFERRSFSAAEVASLIVEVCRGLQAIHECGIIHRDLKPGNILLTNEGHAKITDFGVARERVSRLTAKTQKVGSICYMAPEIWLGKKLTPSVDFYSLGIVLYEIATGEIPFEDPFPGAIMRMHLEDAVVPPKEVNDRVPEWLNELIMMLLEKSAKNRPKSADEIIEFVQKNGGVGLRKKVPEGIDYCKPAVSQTLTRVTLSDEVSSQSSDTPMLSNGHAGHRRGRTYVFSMTASKILDERDLKTTSNRPRRKATVVLPLPKRAAVVFEFETPSRDFIYLGIFFASIQIFDGVLTSQGMDRFSVQAEGNPLLRMLMESYGADWTLFVVKAVAVMIVAFLTILAKHMRWIKDLIATLSCIYLFAAIIPWVFLLYFS